jgi:hypothetical protein
VIIVTEKSLYEVFRKTNFFCASMPNCSAFKIFFVWRKSLRGWVDFAGKQSLVAAMIEIGR